MICSACGCEQFAGAQYCRRCGVRMGFAGGMPMAAVGYGVGMPAMRMARAPRVERHLQPLAITWMIFGGYRLLAGFVAATAFHAFASTGMFGDVPPMLQELAGSLLPMLLLLLVASSGVAVLTGWALLTRKPWARTLAIVMGILMLIKPLFGTALGVYTLWVLAPRASGDEWSGMAAKG